MIATENVMNDILDKRPLSEEIDRSEVLECMNVYAKLIAFDFYKFKAEYQRIESMNIGQEYKKLGGIFSWIGASDEKIWDAYIKDEQLKRYFEE